MAITWGSTVGDYVKLGYEIAKSGATSTVRIYIWTKWSLDDTNNDFKFSLTGATTYEGKVSINTTYNSSWSTSNQKLLKSLTTTEAKFAFNASLTKLDYIGSSLKATVSGSGSNYTQPGKPTGAKIVDNGNNTFTLTATKGSNGTNNKATGVQYRCCYQVGGKWQSWSSWYDFTSPKTWSFSSDKERVDVQVRTKGSYTGNDNAYYYSDPYNIDSIALKYYTQPGKPKSPKIVDNGDNTFTLTATKGSNGTNNTATGMQYRCQYQINKIWQTNSDGTAKWGSWNSFTSPKTWSFTSDKTGVDFQVRTVGTDDGKISDNLLYSDPQGVTGITLKYYTQPGKPKSPKIVDNGDNTFTLTATKGSNGTNNTATGMQYRCQYQINKIWQTNSDGTAKWGSWNSFTSPKTWSFTSDKTGVDFQVRTVGTDDGKISDNLLYSDPQGVTGITLKYYTQPGKPKIYLTNNQDGTCTVKVVVGNSGTNNTATGVEVQYKITGGTYNSWSLWSNNTSKKITVPHQKYLYVRAKTKGTDDGKISDNLLYSDSVSESTQGTQYSQPGVPTNLQIIDNGNNTFKITATKGSDGTNNKATGVEVQYAYWYQGAWNNWTSTSVGAQIDFPDNRKTEGYLIPKIQARTVGDTQKPDIDQDDLYSDYITKYYTKEEQIVKYYTQPGVPTDLQIIDNGDNTFTLSATKGSNGTNNTATDVEVQYKKDTDEEWTNGELNVIYENETPSQIIYMRARTVGTDDEVIVDELLYGEYTEMSDGKKVKYYQAPLILQDENYKPNISYDTRKLTKKSEITYSWNQWNPTNDDSPITGYRVYVYKNDIAIPFNEDMQSNQINYLDVNADIREITFNASFIGLQADDIIKCSVSAKTTNGALVDLWSVNDEGDEAVLWSDDSIVENSAVMYTKINGLWKECEIYPYTNDDWNETEGMYTKQNNNWLESI